MDHYQNTISTWNKLASLYQENFMHLDLYNDTYDIFCNAIKKQPASIFEIGCGPGNITAYLLAKRNDLIIDASDVSHNMAALAKQNNPAANVMVMDARDIHTISKKYDGVICGFCMPYLSKDDCEKLISRSYQLLHEDGIFYCSVIEGPYDKSGYETNSQGDEMHVFYYEESFIRKTLQQHHFTSIQMMRKSYARKNGRTETHLIFIAAKG